MTRPGNSIRFAFGTRGPPPSVGPDRLLPCFAPCAWRVLPPCSPRAEFKLMHL